MHESPLRVSKAPAGGIWEEYRLYTSHLELDTVLGTMVIPFETIERVTRLEQGTRSAGNAEVVLIERTNGTFRRVMIRPAPGFAGTLEEAIGLFRRNLTDH